MATKLTYGDYINWAEPKHPVNPNGAEHPKFCVQCGRKVGKKASYVEVSTAGQIVAAGSPNSQGCWPIGSECAKSFDPQVFVQI